MLLCLDRSKERNWSLQLFSWLNRDLERDLAKQSFRHLDPALPSPTTLCHPDEPVLLQDPEVLLNVFEISL